MPSVYRQILGDEWNLLPDTVKQFHDIERPCRFSGVARVTRGPTWFHHLAAWCGGLPPQQEQCLLTLDIEPATRYGVDGEIWRRHFDAFTLESFQWAHCGLLHESFGWLSMAFRLTVIPPQLTIQVVSARMATVPVPLILGPTGMGIETGKPEGIEFQATAMAPILGMVVRYEGLITNCGPMPAKK